MPQHDPSCVDTEIVLDFLQRILPFSELPASDLRGLVKSCVIDFHPKGTLVFEQGVTEVNSLYLIQSGGVRLFRRDEEGAEILVDYRGEGDSLGGLSMLQGGRALFNAETVEDTFFFHLSKPAFNRLVERHPLVASHYAQPLSEQYVSKAFDSLRTRHDLLPGNSGFYLFSSRVGDLVHSAAVTAPMGRTVQEAAQIMVRHGIGSLLISDPSGEILGIVTDKDLRKTISVGMSCDAPIETIMSSPVATVEHQDICFDALLQMMTRNIHHLAVTRDTQIIGMVTSHDIMVMQGKSPMSLFREILSQQSFEGVYPLAGRIPQVVRTLVSEGAKAGNIARMITVLNDMILDKILALLIKQLGPPPVPFTWLLLGSEGRKEQTFFTDQDNALVYQTTNDDIIQRAADIYFTAFAERAIDHLVKCGIPPCPGNIMASNPKWRQPYDVWRDYFERWIAIPEPEEVMHAAIFFDFRAAFGERSYAEELRNHVSAHCRRQDVFLRYLAANCLEARPPLSFFRNFIVEKNGEHKNTLDIKTRGIAPIVDFARVLALQHGIRETNTSSRLDALHEAGHLPRDIYQDTHEAYELLMQLRLVHQLELVERGETPDNRIAPHRLSELERKTLKEAFGLINRTQSFLKEAFRLNIA